MRRFSCLAVLLLAAAPAIAHSPPPVYISYKVGEEEMTAQVVVSAELFKDWFQRDPGQIHTPRGDLREPVKRAILAGLEEWSVVRIDRVEVKGVLRKVESKKYPDHGIEWQYIHMETVYGVLGKPRQVTVTWKKFDSTSGWILDPIDAELAVWEGGAYFAFTQKEPEFTWHAPLVPAIEKKAWQPPEVEPKTFDIPLVSAGMLLLMLILAPLTFFSVVPRRVGLVTLLLCVMLTVGLSGVAVTQVRTPFQPGFEMPEEDEAKLIFESLHRNIYRAFDYESEGDIYDTLAKSVSGDLLQDVYTEVYRSLIMKEAGGAVCKIQAVTVLDSEVELSEEPGARHFSARCKWRVAGSIGHWGHTHQRVNEYRARYTVNYQEDGWRIADIQVLDQKRLEEEEK